MTSPVNMQVTGSFVSDGLVKNLALPCGYSEFSMINISDIGSTSATQFVMRAYGSSAMAAGSAYYNLKTNGAATLDIEAMTTSNGFTFVDNSATASIGAKVFLTNSASAVNRANPAVVLTGTTTGLVSGSTIVRLYDTVGMLQISSMDFTVGTIVGSTSFQLKYLNNSGFAANCVASGSDAFYRIIPFDEPFYPRHRYITAISQASSAVITLSVTHGFTAGQAVRIYVPSVFGMTQMNGLLGNITAVSTANNTITVDIDSSAFTAFAFPTSATAAAGISFAQVVPVGETAINSSTYPYGNLLDDATKNLAFRGVQIGTSVQTSGSTYQWVAKRATAI